MLSTMVSWKGWTHGLEGCWVPEHGSGAASSPITQVACSKESNTSLSHPCTLFYNVCFNQVKGQKDRQHLRGVWLVSRVEVS